MRACRARATTTPRHCGPPRDRTSSLEIQPRTAVRRLLAYAPGFVFRRTERLHVEWPALKAVDEHIARLLDRNGRPLPLVVALTVQADKIEADLNLAPLGEGDYVIELTAGANGQVEKQLVAFRVVR